MVFFAEKYEAFFHPNPAKPPQGLYPHAFTEGIDSGYPFILIFSEVIFSLIILLKKVYNGCRRPVFLPLGR